MYLLPWCLKQLLLYDRVINPTVRNKAQSFELNKYCNKLKAYCYPPNQVIKFKQTKKQI